MRSSSIILIISVLCVGASAWVFAQAPGDGGREDMDAMTIPQMMEGASRHVEEMERSLTASFKLLEESISSGDVATVTLRNEAITAMKGLVKLSEENYLTLQQKSAEGDRDAVEHEYVKITIAAAKVAELYAQVRSASGVQLDMEITDVERSLNLESSLPMSPEVTSSFFSPQADDVPDEPVHASPYF